ncbi:hypothetical protein N431DRAFT_344797 [Stipitochalara longipes BDJ]|nr:hypothetical protein N431DRAFT_344797 [Stipitochalara longipes BDJ]
MECFMTPNHAASYPCWTSSVIKKRLALSKQVLLLSARHFYIRRPFPLRQACFPFSLLLSRSHHHHSCPLDCMPSGHACRRINREPFKRSEWSSRWQDQPHSLAPACLWTSSTLFRTMAMQSEHSTSTWIAASHIWCLWATRAGSNTILWQLKRRPVFTAFDRKCAWAEPASQPSFAIPN